MADPIGVGAAQLASKVSTASVNTTSISLATVSIPRDDSGNQLSPVVTMRGSGVPLGCTWLAGTVVDDGDTVLVQITGDGLAPKTPIVLGKVMQTACPATGVVTAVPAGSSTITVNAGWLGSINCVFAGTAPAVGDTVMLLWQGGQAVCLGKRSVVAPSGSGSSSGGGSTASGSGSASSGTLKVRATDSGTWTSGYNWNSYFGRSVYQGTWGSTGPSRGCFFYGSGAAGVKNRTITGLRVRLGARKRAGNYNQSVGVTISLHNLRSKQGTPSFTGSQSVTVPAGYTGGWVNLPASWGAQIAAGSGLAITGSVYAGFAGVDADPAAGQIEIVWRN